MTAPINPAQFGKHVQNVIRSVSEATPEEVSAGMNWYPRAHREATHLAQANPPAGNDVAGKHGGKLYTTRESMQRAAGEIAALSPSRPSGMRWEYNVPAAHQLRSMTDQQASLIHSAVESQHAFQQAQGALRAAANRGQAGAGEQIAVELAKTTAAKKSAAARAPFKGSPLGRAGVGAIDKARAIHFAHDILKPYSAHIDYEGMSGTGSSPAAWCLAVDA